MNDISAIATSGLKSVQYQLESISNNIANLNTTNYKRSVVHFQDVMYHPLENNSKTNSLTSPSMIGMGTSISISKDFAQGPLKVTKNVDDIAIKGEGFFEVILEDGSLAYTRSSKIFSDSEGYLQTGDGHRLSANIQVPSDAEIVVIDERGQVLAKVPNQTDLLNLGTISLSKFMNSDGLKPIGAGLYVSTPDSGASYADDPGQNGLGTLEQGMVEGSNVNIVQELTDMMMAQRVYEMNAQMVRMADNLEKITDELRQE